MEVILDEKLIKKTRNKNYYEYLVKWKGLPAGEAVQMSEGEILKHGIIIADLMDMSP